MIRDTDNIHALFQKGKEASLSEAEHTEMKAALLSYAAFHGEKNGASMQEHAIGRRVRARVWTWTMRSAATLGILLFAFVGTGYAATQSLPGDTLYGIKTGVVEPAIGLTKTSPQQKLEYQLSLLQTRYNELKALTAQKTIDQKTLTQAKEHMATHVGNLQSIIDTNTDPSLAHRSVVETTSHAVAVVRAAKELGAQYTPKKQTAVFDDVIKRATDLHERETEKFVGHDADDEVRTYVTDHMDAASSSLAHSGISEETSQQVTSYLNDANEALSNNNLRDAAMFVSEAEQHLEVQKYLHTQ